MRFEPLLTPPVAYCRLLAGIIALASSGCANGAGSDPINSAPIAVVPAASASFVVSSQPQTIALPAVVGYSGSIGFGNASSGVGATAMVSTSLVPPGGGPQLVVLQSPTVPNPPIPLMYIGFAPAATVTLDALPSFAIRIPDNISTSGTFSVALYDPTMPADGFTLGIEGPVAAVDSTIAFTPSQRPVTFQAHRTYAFALYVIPATASAKSSTGGM